MINKEDAMEYEKQREEVVRIMKKTILNWKENWQIIMVKE